MRLPLTGHMSGRGAPLPEPVPEAPPAEAALEPQAGKPVRAVLSAGDGGGLDVTTPLADNATSAEIAAAVAQCDRAADLSRERAEHDQAEAAHLLEDARREAARIIAMADAEARSFTASAAGAEKEAGELAERAARLARAGDLAVKAENSEGLVQDLEDERDRLTGQVAEIGEHLARLAADHQEADANLAAATDSADIDLITDARNRLDSIRGLEDSLTARRAPLLARLEQIGDSEMSPIWPQKELAEARRIASMDRHSVRDALNYALPERPEAVADRTRQHDQLLNKMESDQLAAEEAAAYQARPRTFVRL